MLGLLLPFCLLVAEPQEASPPLRPDAAVQRVTEKHFNVKARRRPAAPLFKALAAEAGVKLKVVNYLPQLASVEAASVTFEQGLAALCESIGAAFRKLEDGTWIVGSENDLAVYSAEAQDPRDVDIIHRCEHLTADSLASVIAKAFPNLRVFAGPNYLSPAVDANINLGADSSKALGIADAAFRTHDVLISGPAGVVKRALALAISLDRPRKQVRIRAKLTELKDSLDSTLGIKWGFPTLTLQEIPDKDLANPANSVKGIKFGSFAHSAAAVTAAIQAQEDAGKAKALANPHLTLLDGERSFVLIGSRQLFPKQTGLTAQGLPTYDTTEVRVGVYLQVAVQVGLNDDINLTVFPQVSTVTEWRTIGNGSYPIISTREAQTTVRLRSGEMVAIGGLTQEVDSSETQGIPLLSRIPLLGRLFGYKIRSKLKSELLLLVTPEILPESGSEGAVTPL